MGGAASIVLLGAGGHACVVAEAAALSGMTVAGYLAPSAVQDRAMLGPCLGGDDQIAALMAKGHHMVPAMGFVDAKGAARRGAVIAALGEAMATIIHPSAVLSPAATLAPGCFVAMGAMIGTNTRIGRAAIVNSGAIVDHDCNIGANAHIATGARIAGGVSVGDDVLIGAGATIRQGVTIGRGAIVGAGAVVLRDVAPGATVVGVPAKAIEVRT